MNTKLCTYCKETKSLNNFYKSKTHSFGVMCYCKQCFNEKCIKRWIQRKIDYIKYKGGKCLDCNLPLEKSHYSVFEFHHVDKKDFDWSKMRLFSKQKIEKELSKCVLLCANCHRIRHANLDF